MFKPLATALLVAAVILYPATCPQPAAAADAQALLGQAQTSLKARDLDKAFHQANAAVEAIWQQMPLHLEQALFVKKPPQVYGAYIPRKSNRYPLKGEPLLIYLEPKGYRMRVNPDGTKSFAVSLDIALTDPQGKVLWGKEGFLRKSITSRHFVREFYLLVTLTVSGAPAGDYVVSLRVNDLVGKQSTVTKLPLELR